MDREELMYWIWLQRAAGKGANLEKLLAPFGGDVCALYRAKPSERETLFRETPSDASGWKTEDLRVAGTRGGRIARKPKKTRKTRPVAESTLQRMTKVSLAEAEEVLDLCARTGVVPLCPTDPRYPALLREIPTRPAVLYALGDVSLFEEDPLPFAMVGARDARLSSLSAASLLAESLARAGFLIVSGGAIGTDSACHIGALNAGCPTVAVLGTGIGTNYLQQNADLRRVISHNGVLLSEMEPGEPGSRGSFPLRNRIIAGMSVGTLVVEAAVKSGSLITSRYAEEYDRDIFVPLFPGVDPDGSLAAEFGTLAERSEEKAGGTQLSETQPRSYSTAFLGTRELVTRETGVGVKCAADVLAAYTYNYGMDPAVLAASGRVSAEELTRDVTDLAGVFPPQLSRAMIALARRQLGADLAGGALNPTPGWGPYRTAEDAELRTYTSAEFAYRRGDHPHRDGLGAAPGKAAPGEAASRETTVSPTRPMKALTSEALRVLGCFRKCFENAADGSECRLYYEELSEELDMAPQYLLAALTELQLASYLDLGDDQRYVCLVDLSKEEAE